MVRVLLCGDLRGGLRRLCDQVSKLHAKLGPEQRFEAVFCVGEFSAEGADDHAGAAPPVPVHFIDCGPAAGELIAQSPQGREVQPGVHFLGHYGVARVAGLSVAFLSGRQRADFFAGAESAAAGAAAAGGAPLPAAGAADVGQAKQLSWEDLRAAEQLAELGRKELFVDGCHYTPLAVERLREEIADSGGVDLLLTCEWPQGCLRGTSKEAREGLDKAAIQRCSSKAVAEIAASAEPKYHAVGLGGVFWRRPPWRHMHRGEVAQSTGQLRCGVCRVVALGAADGHSPAAASAPTGAGGPAGGKPQKWLHGLDLDPLAPPAPADDATPSPWAEQLAGGAGKCAEDASQPLRPVFEPGDTESQRRWMQRFGVLPQEMLSASDKAAKEAEPKEKKEKRQSLYYSQKGEKRFKAGKGGHEGFLQKERRAANGRSAASSF